jgi:hypothetical protein
MLIKALKRKEVELGFISIPAKNRTEILADNQAPFSSTLNGFEVKVDKQGRIWCKELRGKYPVNTEVELSKK